LRQAEPLRSDRDAPELADLELGPHPLAGGFRLPDGRVLSRDLVLFIPGGAAAARLLRFQGRHESDLVPQEDKNGLSAAAVLRDEDVVAWQIGDEVRLYDAQGRPIIERDGKLLRRCADGRIAAYRADQPAGSWSLFDASTDVVFADVPRTPGLLLGLDAACRTLLTQDLDGTLRATPLDDGAPRALAMADGYVYEVRPSAARGGVGSGLLLALSSGAVARVDDATGEVRVLAYATPLATAIGDGPRPGEVAFIDGAGVFVVSEAGAPRAVLEGAAGASWEDFAVAPDGRTMLLASSERIAALDLEQGSLIGSMHSDGFTRLSPWDEEGSVLAWSFDRTGGAEGLVVPRGLGLSQRVARAVSNLRVEKKRLVAR